MRLQQFDVAIASDQNKWIAFSADLDRNERPEQQLVEVDNRPGWYWRSIEGQKDILALSSSRNGPDALDDLEIGFQREED